MIVTIALVGIITTNLWCQAAPCPPAGARWRAGAGLGRRGSQRLISGGAVGPSPGGSPPVRDGPRARHRCEGKGAGPLEPWKSRGTKNLSAVQMAAELEARQENYVWSIFEAESRDRGLDIQLFHRLNVKPNGDARGHY